MKFLLSIILINKLGVSGFGQFSLLQSIITILTFIVGLDFYNYSHRIVIESKFKKSSELFSQQLTLYLLMYILAYPLTFLVIKGFNVDSKLLNILLILIICEHFSQELYRLLIIFGKTLTANFALFLRAGFWVILVYFAGMFNLLEIDLNKTLFLWLFGCLTSILVSLKNLSLKFNFNIDRKSISYGLKVSLPFFVGTVFYKLIEHSGKILLSIYSDYDSVGIFSFFLNYANTIFILVHTVVIIETYPSLIKAIKKSTPSFLKEVKGFSSQIYKYSLIGVFINLLTIYPVLIIVGKTEFVSEIATFVILLLSTFIFNLSFVYHYSLYAMKKDFLILKSMLFGLIITFSIGFLLISKLGVLGASIVHLITNLAILFSKNYFFKQNLTRI